MYIRVIFWISYFVLFYCIVYSSNIIVVYYNMLSFGCCDEEISPFAGQIKEILVLFLILILTGPDGPEKLTSFSTFWCIMKKKLPSLIFFLTPGPNTLSQFFF